VFEAQDPANDEHIDSYTFRDGEIIDTRPVRLTATAIEELPRQLFPLTEVNWDAVPTLAAEAVARLPIEDGQVSHLIVGRPSPGEPVLLRFYVDGPRRSGILDATADGTVVEARLF